MTDKTEWEGHTPLPWAVFPHYFNDDPDERYKDYRLIGRGQYETLAEVRQGCDEVEGHAPADAALIVHCVNSFPALEAERDALREALDMCRAIIKFHVKNAGASCTMADKTFSALDAFNAAVDALAISEKSE